MFGPYIDLFLQFVQPKNRVIDVGCGVGTSTLLLRRAGFQADGTDVSDRFLPPGQEGFYAVNFQNAENIASNSYAAAGTMNVLEHVEQPRQFLLELIRVVRPGGLIILLSPNLSSPLAALRIMSDLWRHRTPYMGIMRFSTAFFLFFINVMRCLRASFGINAFEMRHAALETGITGYDADAVYWTNAVEVRRFLREHGCEICLYQRKGRSWGARVIANLLPGFAGQLCIVARKKQ